jgi:L-asparagine transporter-like permease
MSDRWALPLLMALVLVSAALAVGLRRTRWFTGWRGPAWVLAIGVASAVLHNVVSGLFGIEEAVFFFFAIIAAFTLPIMVVLQLSDSLRGRGSMG